MVRARKLNKRPVRTLILIDDVHAETARMVNFAKSLDHPWQAVHIGVNPEKAELVKEKWKDRIGEGELIIIPSPYRLLAEPIRDYIEKLQQEEAGCFVHVIMGHLVMDTFWEQALHQNSAYLFNLALGRMEHVAVTSVPYQIRRKTSLTDETDAELEAEEPSDAFDEAAVREPDRD